jgi:hypothetical protein
MVEILAGLVRDGFAVAEPEPMTAGGRKIAVTRMTITEAGRRALESRKGQAAEGGKARTFPTNSTRRWS